MVDRYYFQTVWISRHGLFRRLSTIFTTFFDVGMFATANSGTVMHQIEARSDETHSILQRYMIENKLMGIGDAVGDGNRVHLHLLSV